MPSSQELRSYYRRMLYMLKDIERESPGKAVRKHIEAVEVEMDAEDVAYVNEKLKKSGEKG